MDGVPSRDRPIARLTVDSHNITALRAPKRHKGRSTDRCGLGTYLYLKVPYQHLSAPPSFVPLGAQSAVTLVVHLEPSPRILLLHIAECVQFEIVSQISHMHFVCLNRTLSHSVTP